MGRPLIKIDPDVVKSLAQIQCTDEEISSVVGCDDTTLRRRFARILKEGRAIGKCSLRRQQWKIAFSEGSGRAAAAIWLGKVILHQREMVPIDDTPASQRAADIITALRAIQALEDGKSQ